MTTKKPKQLLRHYMPRNRADFLVQIFAFASIGCYYWFRAPVLLGFGLHRDSGLLIDATGVLPVWFPHAGHAVTTLFFGGLLLRKRGAKRAWTRRPPFRS